jgi:hypothetical protein
MSTTFTSPFTGTVVEPTDVSYYALNFSTNTQLYWPAVVNPTQVPASRIMDCTPSTTGLTVILPQGNQGSVGTDILIRNKGAVAFTVTAFDASQSVTVSAGTSRYFYLSSNTTEAGVWQNVQFGTGTSAADAATLQGAGLTTITGQLAVTSNVVEVSSTPTINDASRAATFVWTNGNGNFTLPNAAGLSGGWFIGFRNNGFGTLSITPTPNSLINGQTTISTNPGDSGYILYEQSTGNFFTVGWAVPSNVTFTSATYDVDSISGSSLNLVSYAPIIQTYVALSGTRTTTLNVTLPAITQIYVLVNNTTSGAYSISFNVSGSSTSPIVLSAGQVVTALSDGNTLFALTTSTVGVFFANNGSASAPSYSFNSDHATGMYLVGTSVLGLTANSVQMLRIDNTNTSSPQISTPATFTAGLISGGAF